MSTKLKILETEFTTPSPQARRRADRRHFLKTFTFVSAASSLLGRAWSGVLAAEVRLAATTTTGTLRIKLSDFPALLSEAGSVRLGLNPLRGGPPSGPTPDGTYYPLIISRGANDKFYAVSSKCTHQNCVVDAYDGFSDQIRCPCHNSLYKIDGARISGPASGPLTRYTAAFDGKDTLTVQVPNLGYTVLATQLQSSADGPLRFRLDFRASRNVSYAVYFRASLGEDPVSVSFSSTADGPLAETVFTATVTGNVGFFVESSTASGFYMIGIQPQEV